MTTAEHRRAAPKRLAVVLVLVALLIAAGLAWVLRPDGPGRPFAMGSPTLQPVSVPRPPSTCGSPATAPFTPTHVSIPHVVKNADVLALPRDGNNVPGVPPTSAKFTFAWDRPGIKPGSPRGNVLLNAHTWPDGSAVGNVMLDKLHEGDRIVLRGARSELCYSVSKRVEVLASKGYPPYYARDGVPQIALIVCSGQRLGPGQWTHRTIWFADPVA